MIMIVSYLYYINGWSEAEDVLCNSLQKWEVRKRTRRKVKLVKPFFKVTQRISPGPF